MHSNIPESQLRDAIKNRRVTSSTAVYHLLNRRVQEGRELPDQSKPSRKANGQDPGRDDIPCGAKTTPPIVVPTATHDDGLEVEISCVDMGLNTTNNNNGTGVY